jgi:hypothetical protein
MVGTSTTCILVGGGRGDALTVLMPLSIALLNGSSLAEGTLLEKLERKGLVVSPAREYVAVELAGLGCVGGGPW